MAEEQAFTLEELANCLPEHMNVEWLRNHIDQSLWENAPQVAAARLAVSDLLDFKDYLARYPDVAEKRIDPVWHFIAHGVKEQRIVRLKGEKFLDEKKRPDKFVKPGTPPESEESVEHRDSPLYERAMEQLAIAHLKQKLLQSG